MQADARKCFLEVEPRAQGQRPAARQVGLPSSRRNVGHGEGGGVVGERFAAIGKGGSKGGGKAGGKAGGKGKLGGKRRPRSLSRRQHARYHCSKGAIQVAAVVAAAFCVFITQVLLPVYNGMGSHASSPEWSPELAYTCMNMSQEPATRVVEPSKDPTLLRSDNRCGPRYRDALGRETQCNGKFVGVEGNYSYKPCCNRVSGWCGFTPDHCSCDACVIYFANATSQPRTYVNKSGLPPSHQEPLTKSAAMAPLDVFVIVPGFGVLDRKPLLIRNVEWLRRQEGVRINCTIYVYRDLPLVPEEFSPCALVNQLGQWTSFVSAPNETLWENADLVLVWLDDVLLQPGASLLRMAEVMFCNSLAVLSPSYWVSDRNSAQLRRWLVMYQRDPLQADRRNISNVGRLVNFVEWQFTLMTPGAFRCFRSLINPEVNPRGWGIDTMFPYVCAGHCIGVTDETTMYDALTGSYDKPAAQEEMKEFYRRHGRPANIKETIGALLEPRVSCGSDVEQPKGDWAESDPLMRLETPYVQPATFSDSPLNRSGFLSLTTPPAVNLVASSLPSAAPPLVI